LPLPVYQIRNLTHCYADKPALSVESLSISPASIMGLMGPNGSGKSTLLKILAFVQRPTRGEVHYNGVPVASFDDTVRLEVTLLPQTPYLMNRSVYENIRYGLKIRRDLHDQKKRILEAMEWVGLSPTTYARRHGNALSGGEAQRVALAARLILRPRVLLLDEPIASVDAASAQLIREATLRARRQWGTTLVIASHDRQWLLGICDELRYLFNGRVFQSGMTNMVFGPWLPRTDGFWEKLLHDEAHFIVSPPPQPQSVAVISPEAFSLRLPRPASQESGHKLIGTLSQLALGKSTLDAIAEVVVGDASFSVSLSRRQLTERDFFPGQKVEIAYEPSHIEWL
jgi:tungstate transport system ATP-binding protein